MKATACILAGIVLASAGPAPGRDWPQWRGPFLNGSTDETNLPVRWSADENMKWTADLPGRAYSTPIVCAGRIFLVSTVEGNNDLVGMCLDEKTGKVLWTKKLSVGYPNMPGKNQASCSPVSDGKVVVFLFGSGTLAGLDYEGKLLWRRELVREYGPMAAKWGYSASPLLYKGKVYVMALRCKKPYRGTAPGGKPLDSYLLCVEPATGKTLFRHVRKTWSEGEDRETYATPIPAEFAGRSEILLVGGDHLTGHDPDTGRELWRWCYNPKDEGIWRRVVPSPVVDPDNGLVFVIRSQDKPKVRPMYALKLGLKGKVPDRGYVWRFPASDDLLGRMMTTDVCTPLLYKGRLYLKSDTEKTLTCLDPKTGRIIWRKALLGTVFRAAPTGADGKVYCMDWRGNVTVIAAGDEFRVLGRAQMKERATMASIVAANGRLYIRGKLRLYCIGK